MNVWIGWGLAVIAIAIGYVQYGWPGVAMAVTVVVFWLLLQFSRALRVMRTAAGRPVGHVENAVMLNAKLRKGMALSQVVMLTRSLGRQESADPEVWTWQDAAGDSVKLEWQGGKLVSWQLHRCNAEAADASP